jgi:hypothetical protein
MRGEEGGRPVEQAPAPLVPLVARQAGAKPVRGGRTASRCSDRRDTDAVVEGKGVAEVCLAPLGRQLCGRHQRRACPPAMRSAARPRIARELAN